MAGAEATLADALRRWVRTADARSRWVLAATAVVTALALVVAGLGLGVDADTQKLLDPDLPFQKRDREFARAFPTLTESLLVVVDGESADAVRQATLDLGAALRARPALFTRVSTPGAGDFFEAHALLYRSPDDLEALVDRLAQLQPVLAQLVAEPTIASLCRVIRLGLERAAPDPAAAEELRDVFDQFGRAAVAVYAEVPVSVSWESILLAGSSLDPTRRLVVVADPVLDFDRVLQAKAPIDAIRDAARELDFASRGVTVRITGYPALNHDEMLGLFWDVGVAGVASFALVLLILWLALRSWRMVLAAAVNLLVGLALTAAFAALAVGELNIVSIAAAVLFIGLGVDFCIHLGMQYAAARRAGRAHAAALDGSVAGVGTPLVLCTATTAIGFFAFVPTDYRGVAQLGLISGGGMLVILFLTLTLFPVLLRVLCGDTPLPAGADPARLERGAAAFVERHATAVLVVGAAVLLASAVLVPRVRFDSNVVEMRNPDTESVRAFHDLLAESTTSPWYVDVVARDEDEAELRARRLEEIPEVERALTLLDYVPADQDEKLMILEDATFLLDAPGASSPPPAPDVPEQLRALRDLAEALRVPWVDETDAPLGRSARLLRARLDATLARLDADPSPEAALQELEDSLLGRLPERLERLREAVATPPIARRDLPESLVERMVAADGRTRIQVFPAQDMRDDRALARFVAAVRAEEPLATGLPVNIVEFGAATSRSLRQALAWALSAIALLLLVMWRRPLDVVLVLAPLFWAGLVSVGIMTAVDLPFNFANVIVLPLLLGIGVDSGIHLVARARHPLEGNDSLVDTVTARAVLWSALTTLVSFSTLASSGHRGIASLGMLLSLGMATTLLAVLALLPALLSRLGRLEHR